MDNESICNLLNSLRSAANKKPLDDSNALSDENYYRLTGVTKDQFHKILKSVAKQTSIRCS
jgi:hypothetical protein